MPTHRLHPIRPERAGFVQVRTTAGGRRFKPVRVIGIEIAVIGRDDRVPTFQHAFHLPTTGTVAAGCFGGSVFGNAVFLVVRNPLPGDGDGGIRVDGMVAVKIQTQKDRIGFFPFVRLVNQDVDFGVAVAVGEMDGRYLPRGLAAERALVPGNFLKPHAGRFEGHPAVYFLFENPYEFRSPFPPPRARVVHRGSVFAHEGIGEGVRRHLGFVVVVSLGLRESVHGKQNRSRGEASRKDSQPTRKPHTDSSV